MPPVDNTAPTVTSVFPAAGANGVDPATGAPSPALATAMLEETRRRGLLIGKGGLAGHTLRMAPPLTLTEADAKEGLGILTDALHAVSDQNAAG